MDMNRTQRTIFLIVAVASFTAYAYQYFIQPVGFGDISVETAAELIETVVDLVILDVRTESEFNEEHIENAILIPVQELATRLDELSKESTLLIYCRTGNRSSTAVDILTENGFTMIYHMDGGITAWKAAGYPTV